MMDVHPDVASIEMTNTKNLGKAITNEKTKTLIMYFDIFEIN